MLLPPQFDQKRRQDLQQHPRAVDADMTPPADSNKVAILGDAWPPVMDRERPAHRRPDTVRRPAP
jgi:hypothetical protein